MKFNCERSLLQTTVGIASRAAAAKSAVPSLEGLLVEAHGETVYISGYDLKTGIRSAFHADVIENGAIVLNSRLFGDIVRKMPDDTVTVTVDENCMTNIKCGMSDFNIMGIPAEDYPELPSVDERGAIYIPEGVLRDMINETNFAVSDNEARPIHTGELFEVEGNVLSVVAVDGYRLALRKELLPQVQTGDCSFVVPGSALSELGKILGDGTDLVKIVPGAKHIMFVTGSTEVLSRRLEGEFLNYRNSIPKNNKYSLDIDRHDFIRSVERVSLIIDDRLKSPVRCLFGNGMLKITASTPLGMAYDECPVNGSAEELEIGFNNKYILDALRAAPAERVRVLLTSGVSPCIILPVEESEDFVYMILPVRLRANEG